MGFFTTIDQVVNIYIFRFLADLLIPCRFTRWAIRYRLPFIFENKNQSNWGFGFSVVFAHKSLGYQRNSRVHEPCIQIVRGQLARPNGFFANQSPKKKNKTERKIVERLIFLRFALNCFAFKILILMLTRSLVLF